MKKLLILLLVFFASIISQAQVDTTSWYPLQTGNYWEYSNFFGAATNGNTVIGDTIMPNNKVYKIIEQVDLNNPVNISYRYLRLENNEILYSYRFNTEMEEFDFTKSIGELWLQSNDFYVGLIDSWYGTEYITLTTSTRKFFDYFDIDSSSVPPDTMSILGLGPVVYQRGIGKIQSYDSFLRGVILNGVKYGTITDVKDNSSLIPYKFSLYQNYPNPFNPSTQIKYELPKGGFVTLKVYDLLGREVATLVNYRQSIGSYVETFDAAKLSAGVYIYSLNVHTGNGVDFSSNKKMLLLK